VSHFEESFIEIICFSLDSDDEKRQWLYQYLSDDEKQRAARYRFDKHRHRFITGRGTIREILADLGKCPPKAISFELNKFGKPALCAPESSRHIRFNASSSAMMGAIAISDGIALGLDIEKMKPAKGVDNDLIVKNEFTRDEYDWYIKHRDSDRPRIFFEFWTCKEAYLKALGIGLSGKLDSFSVDLTGQQPSVSYTGLEHGEQSMFSLQQFNIPEKFVACLALPEKNSQIKLSYW
jgi:4'-phosphopantetheinyl transferase